MSLSVRLLASSSYTRYTHVHVTNTLALKSKCTSTLQIGMQRYHFLRTNPIPKIVRYRSKTIPAQFFVLNQCRIYILLCVEPIVTLLRVKYNLLQCFSTGRSKVLGMQPKSGSRGRSEWVADYTQPKKRHQFYSNCFSDARLLF